MIGQDQNNLIPRKPFLGNLSPVLGSILSGITGGLFGIGATVMQNAFNSPRAQLRRLRKAGLPLAYMYGGNVATQSEVPRLSLDNDLGASEQQNLNLQRELQNAQIPKIISEKEFQDLINEIKGGEAEWLKRLVGELPPGGVDTNQQFLLNLNKQAQLTKSWITDNSRQLKSYLVMMFQMKSNARSLKSLSNKLPTLYPRMI